MIAKAIALADAVLAAIGYEIHTDEKAGDYYYEEVEQKRWILGDGGVAGNCDVCDDNEGMGWVDMDAGFAGVDGIIDEPPAHLHCTCTVEQKTRRQRVYV